MKIALKFLQLLCLMLFSSDAIAADPDVELYLTRIKPVLKERCFACHGALKQEADLRLDTVAAMRDNGVLKSELLDRITSKDDDVRMPPEGEPLEKHQVDAIRHWISQGAKAPKAEVAETDPMQHWAFQKIRRPPVPDVGEDNPIDAFLKAKHIELGLKTQPASRRTLLLRRLYLDVTGLPPTVEQLQSDPPFVGIVDALLDSPQYGERWGRHWMDIWRYSDWFGLGSMLRNSQKHIWHWRDWIVDSLNDDKSYARMVSEMLAGDEIAPLDRDAVTATGFLARNYYLFNRTTWLDDTIEHTSKAFLGLTMNCAKCHDHKYDPISHEDYYRLRAIFEPHHVRLDALPGETDFNKNALPRVYDDKPDAPTYLHARGNPANPVKDNAIAAGVPEFLAGFAHDAQSVKLPVDAWAPGVRDYVQKDHVAKAEANVKSARKKLDELLEQKESQTALKANEADAGTVFVDDFKSPQPAIWKTIGDGWQYRDGHLSQTMPTMARTCLRTIQGHPRDFDLTLQFRTTGGVKWKSTGIRFDVDENAQHAHTVYASAVAGGSKVQLAHTVSGQQSYPAKAKVDRPILVNETYVLNVKVRDTLVNVALGDQFLFAYSLPQRRSGSIELFAFDATADFFSIEVKPLPGDVVLRKAGKTSGPVDFAKSVEIAEAELTLAEAELAALNARIAADNAMYRGVQSGGRGSRRAEGIQDSERTAQQELRPPNNMLEEAAARLQLEMQLAQAAVEVLKADAAKRPAAIKLRDAARKALEGGKLPDHAPLRGSERALNKKSDNASQYPPIYAKVSTGRRTALAKWIVHRDNPLTARVAVNHIWMRHFGTPLVESVFDFGRRAPRPLHHELLDYLAVEFIESGWSMKHLHRIILNSKTWQRTSSNLNVDLPTIEGDPTNHYYWRMNSRRMESQVLRDSLLFHSGTLDLTRGGPSVKAGPNVRRRSLYLTHSRDGRDKLLSTFDDADIFACYRRSESIVPQQALALLNSRESIEAAPKILAQINGTDEQLNDADFARKSFLRLLGRMPTESELTLSLEFLEENPARIHFIHGLLNHNDFLVIR